MSTQHEPGPWTVLNNNGVFVLAEGGLTVAEVSYMLPDAKGETKRLANASLLAAAPEMFDVLTAIEFSLGQGMPAAVILDENSPIRDFLRTAIAKAAALPPPPSPLDSHQEQK